jgi:hypothetical protein
MAASFHTNYLPTFFVNNAFYIYGDPTPDNTGINVTIANITIDGNNAKADIWARTRGVDVPSNINIKISIIIKKAVHYELLFLLTKAILFAIIYRDIK